MKKQTALILAAVMMVQMLAGCSEKASENENTQPSGSEVSESINTDDTAAEPTEEELLYGSLTPKDYDGYTFRFMTAISNYGITYMDVEGLTGDIINDTVYERNRAIEQELNITVYEEGGLGYSEPVDRLNKMVTAGDDESDVIFCEAYYMAPVVTNHYMHNLYDIPNIDWDKPWWEKSIRDFFEIKDKLFFTYTPMNLHYYEALVTPLFNKQIAAEYQIEDLYTTVREGKWTIDKMGSIAQSVVSDRNGDGKMKISDDLYGISASTNLVVYMPLAAGARYTEKGEDGLLKFIGATDHLVSCVEKLHNIFGVNDVLIENGDYIRLFQESHALFFLDVLGRVKDFRSLETDFGIIPLPKYDETQANYVSAAFVGSGVMIVPITNQMYTEIGTILEYFGAYSHRYLIPAYYEKNIQGKQTRDEQSVEMLEIMLSNITADLSVVYGWGSMTDKILSAAKKGEGFASSMKSTTKVVQKNIEKWYEAFE